jgi:hypothetical protein
LLCSTLAPGMSCSLRRAQPARRKRRRRASECKYLVSPRSRSQPRAGHNQQGATHADVQVGASICLGLRSTSHHDAGTASQVQAPTATCR